MPKYVDTSRESRMFDYRHMYMYMYMYMLQVVMAHKHCCERAQRAERCALQNTLARSARSIPKKKKKCHPQLVPQHECTTRTERSTGRSLHAAYTCTQHTYR